MRPDLRGSTRPGKPSQLSWSPRIRTPVSAGQSGHMSSTSSKSPNVRSLTRYPAPPASRSNLLADDDTVLDAPSSGMILRIERSRDAHAIENLEHARTP